MSIKITDVPTGPLPGQHTIRVECLICRKYFEGDYIPAGNERDRQQVVQWIAEQCVEQLRVAGCPHAEDADLELPAFPRAQR